MSSQSLSPEDLFQTYLRALPLPGNQITSAQVESGQIARRDIVKLGDGAVPTLLDSIATQEFTTKDAAFDLILEIGDPARSVLHRERGLRGPVVDMWIASALLELGEPRALDRLWPLLTEPEDHVRHLAALTLSFRLEDAAAHLEILRPVLLEALDDLNRIEGTPFIIAASALAMLSRLTGDHLFGEIRLYNFDSFVYPPPLHPFPFAADILSQVPSDEQDRIRKRARQRWVLGNDGV
jgi:HEAT repeat protein